MGVRVVHPDGGSWRRFVDAAVFFSVGLFFFAVSVPAWFAGIYLPHPLVGLGLMLYAVVHPRRIAARDRSIEIAIGEDGVRRGEKAIAWTCVRGMTVRRGPLHNTVSVLGDDGEGIDFPEDWPGCTEVMQAVMMRANLKRVRSPWWDGVAASYAPST